MSRWLNPRVKTFPLGTFAVNIAGTAVLGGLAVGGYEVRGKFGCGLLLGVADGFCGCLTTVSTFVVEFTGMPREYAMCALWANGADLVVKHAYRYAVATVVAGLLVMIVVLGSYVGRPIAEPPALTDFLCRFGHTRVLINFSNVNTNNPIRQ